ncbi:MAG: twin-arginine translocation signal domain-containing protein [Deltaproteobacteria bacterium]
MTLQRRELLVRSAATGAALLVAGGISDADHAMKALAALG